MEIGSDKDGYKVSTWLGLPKKKKMNNNYKQILDGHQYMQHNLLEIYVNSLKLILIYKKRPFLG